jgi:hypothetical protein
VWRSLFHKHVEALHSSESEDFDTNSDRSDNSNSDVTDSGSKCESDDDSGDIECDISTLLAQKEQ